ncbi:MAG: hypothetical protein ACI8WB_004877 [Phenylobacterium sp.]|jgi:hypothetical protein
MQQYEKYLGGKKMLKIIKINFTYFIQVSEMFVFC